KVADRGVATVTTVVFGPTSFPSGLTSRSALHSRYRSVHPQYVVFGSASSICSAFAMECLQIAEDRSGAQRRSRQPRPIWNHNVSRRCSADALTTSSYCRSLRSPSSRTHRGITRHRRFHYSCSSEARFPMRQRSDSGLPPLRSLEYGMGPHGAYNGAWKTLPSAPHFSYDDDSFHTPLMLSLDCQAPIEVVNESRS
ncbi:hypothetical protein BVRB_025110, partial [Beta vulgaris subsp. vulgaris]